MSDILENLDPDPSYFICFYCEHRVEVPQLPQVAWLKGAGPRAHYRHVCTACRQNGRPTVDHYRCLTCKTNVPIPEEDRAAWRRDPTARIVYFDDPRYADYCPKCGSARVAAREAVARARLAIEHQALIPGDQMNHVRELQLSYESEIDTLGHYRYDRAGAIERAVGLEMLVADSARWPGFMSWLRDHPSDPLADPLAEDGEMAA